MAMSDFAPLTKWSPLAWIASFDLLVRSMAVVGILYQCTDAVGIVVFDEEKLFGRAMFVYEQTLVGKAHFCGMT